MKASSKERMQVAIDLLGLSTPFICHFGDYAGMYCVCCGGEAKGENFHEEDCWSERFHKALDSLQELVEEYNPKAHEEGYRRRETEWWEATQGEDEAE